MDVPLCAPFILPVHVFFRFHDLSLFSLMISIVTQMPRYFDSILEGPAGFATYGFLEAAAYRQIFFSCKTRRIM
jgi:hypothetical protein